LPSPIQPTIAAFTPHHEGAFGVTIGEYEVEIERRVIGLAGGSEFKESRLGSRITATQPRPRLGCFLRVVKGVFGIFLAC
jgi:hypothetical protein